MEYPPVVQGFVPKDEQQSDMQIAIHNMTALIMLEKQKAWKEGFEAAIAITEEARRRTNHE